MRCKPVNSLAPPFMEELAGAIGACEADTRVRALVLTSGLSGRSAAGWTLA